MGATQGDRCVTLLKVSAAEARVMHKYLASSDVIDWQQPDVVRLARRLAHDAVDTTALTRRCFECVRDEIEHSVDFDRSEVTCRASDVLAARTGFCYAKSHLLAALLRANGIPAAPLLPAAFD